MAMTVAAGGAGDVARPLEGVRVIDWSTSVAGAWCSRFLAGCGADVILVEARAGHPLRSRPDSTTLLEGKRAVALDIDSPRGKRLALDLARRSDVLVSSAPPEVLEALGIGYATLRRPALVMAHVLDDVNGASDGAYLVGIAAAVGVLAALRHRQEHPGEGQEVTIDASAALAGVTSRASSTPLGGVPFTAVEGWWSIERPAPRPGEHSFDVLRRVAGITDDHLMSYFESGVIGTST